MAMTVLNDSLEVLRILCSLRPAKSMVYKEVKARTGLSKNRVFYLLGRLMDSGLVERAGRDVQQAGDPRYEYAITRDGKECLERFKQEIIRLLGIPVGKEKDQEVARDMGMDKEELGQDLFLEVRHVLEGYFGDEDKRARVAGEVVDAVLSVL